MIDFATTIDWLSIKLTGLSVFIAAISGSAVLQWLSGVAVASTIIYNLIRIYKELKKEK